MSRSARIFDDATQPRAFLVDTFPIRTSQNLPPFAVLFCSLNQGLTSEVCSILVPFCWLQTPGEDPGQGCSYSSGGIIQCHKTGHRMWCPPHINSTFLMDAHHQAKWVHNTSFTANILRDAESEKFHEGLKCLSGSLRETFHDFHAKILFTIFHLSVVGSIGTNSTTIGTFIPAMVLYPEVQSRAQKEMEFVIGRNRFRS